MKQILYATDCSEHSVPALKYVLQFANTIGAQLNLLHVYSLPPIVYSTFRSPEQLSKNASVEHLEVLKKYHESYHPVSTDSVPVEFYVKESNSIANTILTTAAEITVDLVVVGRKDEHSTRGLFAGNIASALLDKLECPLLIIPDTISPFRIHTMVYASDFEADDVLAISYLQAIAKSCSALLKVVHIPTKKEYSGTEQMEWFKDMVDQNVKSDEIDYHLVLSDSVLEGIQSFVIDTEADLFGMLEREEKGFFNRFIYGDKVRRMKSASTIPLLCFNRKCFA